MYWKKILETATRITLVSNFTKVLVTNLINLLTIWNTNYSSLSYDFLFLSSRLYDIIIFRKIMIIFFRWQKFKEHEWSGV